MQPIFVAAALDYDVKEGKEDGKVQSAVCEEIRKQRKAAANCEDLGVTIIPGASAVIRQNPDNCIVALGRIAWRETLNGLNDGCIASLNDTPASNSADAPNQDQTEAGKNISNSEKVAASSTS